jgi:hypothetical protein
MHDRLQADVRRILEGVADKDVPALFDEVVAEVKGVFVEHVLDRYQKSGKVFPPEILENDFGYDALRIVNGRDDTGRFPQIWDGSKRIL